MKNFYIKLSSLTLLVALSGCGTSDLIDNNVFDTDIGSGGGSDSLTLTKTSDDNFDLTWEKKYSGYSEAVYKNSRYNNERGHYFLTGNAKTTHVLHCTVSNADADSISYSCENDNHSVPMYESVSLRFQNGTNTFYTSEGIDHNLKKAATLTYDGNSHSISISQ